MKKSFYILSPLKSISGGVESLHQLADSLDKLNQNVKICYYPSNGSKYAYKFFKNYNFDYFEGIDLIPDKKNSIIIFPEVNTKLTLKFKFAIKIIYWLSVDNFFPFKENNYLKNIINFFNFRYNRLFLFQMKKYIHLSESHYSKVFLKNKNLNNFQMTDYVKIDYKIQPFKKLNIICYNPKKGERYIKFLKNKFPVLEFIPLINLDKKEILKFLSKSKIYIDFGRHPGRDRIPREAGLCNCCIITNRMGSAKNDIDVGILDKYKFNNVFKEVNQIYAIINDIFQNYEILVNDFKSYKNNLINDYTKSQSDLNYFINQIDIFYDK